MANGDPGSQKCLKCLERRFLPLFLRGGGEKATFYGRRFRRQTRPNKGSRREVNRVPFRLLAVVVVVIVAVVTVFAVELVVTVALVID